MEVSFNVAPIFSQFTALDCIPDTKSYQQAFFRACNPTFGHVMTYLVIKSMPAFHLILSGNLSVFSYGNHQDGRWIGPKSVFLPKNVFK